jgi:hypothetical protein
MIHSRNVSRGIKQIEISTLLEAVSKGQGRGMRRRDAMNWLGEGLCKEEYQVVK